MPRADLDVHFKKIDDLILEINRFVPSNDFSSVQFRANLAGLLVVAMSATYENCVKEVIQEFAGKHNAEFGKFAQRNYEKLNSRVQIRDLNRYCELFDPSINIRFKDRLKVKKKAISERVGKNIETSYEQILSWRHDFAHAGIQKTTIEEAAATHRLGKRILYIFEDSFNRA
jgi:RiboL-PSP-HEPN